MYNAATDPVVSSEAENLILVDSNDDERGVLSKAACHDGRGVLHRAFSVFLFNDAGELLLQQRAAGKRLWPGYWSNSCCSHPREGEDMETATVRRLEQELRVTADLEFIYKFEYQAQFGDAGAEHELCWVYLGRCHGEPDANSTEVSALRWVEPDALDAELAQEPAGFTPWFRMEWERLRGEFAGRLAGYTGEPQPT